MVRQARCWLCALLVVATSLWLPSGDVAAQGGADVDYLLSSINGVRAANGLAPYSLNPLLVTAAQAHSEDMAAVAAALLAGGSDISGAVTHTGSDGSSATTRVQATGYPAIQVGENIYATLAGPQAAMDWWLGSAAHTNNILHGTYREIGIGAAPGPEGLTMYTLVFAHSADSPVLPAPPPLPTSLPPTLLPTDTPPPSLTPSPAATRTPAPTATTAHVNLPRPVTLTPTATQTIAGASGGGLFASGNEARVILLELAAAAVVVILLLFTLRRKAPIQDREE